MIFVCHWRCSTSVSGRIKNASVVDSGIYLNKFRCAERIENGCRYIFWIELWQLCIHRWIVNIQKIRINHARTYALHDRKVRKDIEWSVIWILVARLVERVSTLHLQWLSFTHVKQPKRKNGSVGVSRHIPLIWYWHDGTTIRVESFVIELSVHISMRDTRWTMALAHLGCDVPKCCARNGREKKSVQNEIELAELLLFLVSALFFHNPPQSSDRVRSRKPFALGYKCTMYDDGNKLCWGDGGDSFEFDIRAANASEMRINDCTL